MSPTPRGYDHLPEEAYGDEDAHRGVGLFGGGGGRDGDGRGRRSFLAGFLLWVVLPLVFGLGFFMFGLHLGAQRSDAWFVRGVNWFASGFETEVEPAQPND